MNRRATLVLGLGVCAIAAVSGFSRWLVRRNRPIFPTEQYADSSRAYAARVEYLTIRPRRLNELNEKYRSAARVVAEVLVSQGKDLTDLRAQVEERADRGLLVFHLYDTHAFRVMREAKKQGLSAIGNPGGGCCDVGYNEKSGCASLPLLWQ